jgi:hypothetical protein
VTVSVSVSVFVSVFVFVTLDEEVEVGDTSCSVERVFSTLDFSVAAGFFPVIFSTNSKAKGAFFSVSL